MHVLILEDEIPAYQKLISCIEQFFDQMPSNSYFINNGRSSHVNENDLCLALKRNLSAAAIDVLDLERISKKTNLLEIENLLITPHIGAVDPSYWPSQIELFEYNLECFLNNNLSLMKNICNPFSILEISSVGISIL